MYKPKGLSSQNINLLAILTFMLLLLLDSYGIFFKGIYLIAIPVGVWLILTYVGNRLNITSENSNLIDRAIVGSIAIIFFIMAYQTFTIPYHFTCTHRVRVWDGYECVGDYVTVAGRDIFMVLLFTVIGIIATWYSILRKVR
jgi:hypothetical protein